MCSRCAGTMNTKAMPKIDFLKCAGGSLEIVDGFCYLGGKISSNCDCSESTVVRIGTSWEKFRELLPLLVAKGLFLLSGTSRQKLKRNPSNVCVIVVSYVPICNNRMKMVSLFAIFNKQKIS